MSLSPCAARAKPLAAGTRGRGPSIDLEVKAKRPLEKPDLLALQAPGRSSHEKQDTGGHAGREPGRRLGGRRLAGVLGYSLDRADRGFERRGSDEPSAATVATDGLIARPLGLATTIAGTGLFVVTLPFSTRSGSVREAARGMIGRPGGWTFVRPLGGAMSASRNRESSGNKKRLAVDL